jgi:hypothetical protein
MNAGAFMTSFDSVEILESLRITVQSLEQVFDQYTDSRTEFKRILEDRIAALEAAKQRI